MPAEPGLRKTQTWMQRFIVDPRADSEVYERSARSAARLVRPSRTLSPVERVAIYRDMYLLRMEEALAGDFPALKHFLGEKRFMRLVAGYVQAHPSRSYTLSRLRSRLPAHVLAGTRLRGRGFAADLARLELAMCEAFDEEEAPVLSPGEAAVLAGGLRARAKLRTIPALRLLAFLWPADEYLQAFKDGTRPPPIRRRKSRLAVYRRDGMLWRLRLSRQAFGILDTLRKGRTLGAALRAGGGSRRAEQRQVFHYFRRWVSEGLISSIE